MFFSGSSMVDRKQTRIPPYEECKEAASKVLDVFIRDGASLQRSAGKLIPSLQSAKRSLKKYHMQSLLAKRLDSIARLNTQHLLLYKMNLQALDDGMQYFFVRDQGVYVSKSGIPPPLLELKKSIQTYRKFLRLDFSNPDSLLANLSDFLNKYELGFCADWLNSQLDHTIGVIPADILKSGGFGKLIRTLLGVLMYKISDMDTIESSPQMRAEVFRALKAGYLFGLGYPLCDDVMDRGEVHLPGNKPHMLRLIGEMLKDGRLNEQAMAQDPVASELKHAFKELTTLFPFYRHNNIYTAMLNLHMAQMEDGSRLFEENYAEQEIYIPMIVKAAYTRIVAALLAEKPIDEEFIRKIMFMGFSLQMVDDFRDFSIDMQEGTFSSFTYKVKGAGAVDKCNPLLLYLASLGRVCESFGNRRKVKRLVIKRLCQGIKQYIKQSGDQDLKMLFSYFPLRNKVLEREMRDIAGLSNYMVDVETEFMDGLTAFSIKQYAGQTNRSLLLERVV